MPKSIIDPTTIASIKTDLRATGNIADEVAAMKKAFFALLDALEAAR